MLDGECCSTKATDIGKSPSAILVMSAAETEVEDQADHEPAGREQELKKRQIMRRKHFANCNRREDANNGPDEHAR
jgi:hypothetical protein